MASTKKGIYSKDKIQEMIFDNSMLKEYKKEFEAHNMAIGVISLIISAIPTIIGGYALYKILHWANKHDLDGLHIGQDEYAWRMIGGVVVIIIIALLAWIIMGGIIGFFLKKVFGKYPTFREFSEPVLLGYELALKRFEVENKIQDYEFMFENKEFFHGLHIIRDILKVRNMELDNQLAMIPIEQKNRESEVYQKLLERKIENERQYDWLGDQLKKLDK